MVADRSRALFVSVCVSQKTKQLEVLQPFRFLSEHRSSFLAVTITTFSLLAAADGPMRHDSSQGLMSRGRSDS